MEYIKLTKENLEEEHICCAISNNKDLQVSSKKEWLNERLDEGLVFLKANERGKCFIEYIDVEKAWAPVLGKDYTYINCLWVSGKFKGHGYSEDLLNECIKDSKEKGKNGLVILSSDKKRGFLSDPRYLEYKGFTCIDTMEPYFKLYCLSFNEKEKPSFIRNDKKVQEGFVINYTSACPFTAKYVPLLKEVALKKNAPISIHHIKSNEEAKNSSCPSTIFSLYYNGEFITHEILSEKKFEGIIEKYMK